MAKVTVHLAGDEETVAALQGVVDELRSQLEPMAQAGAAPIRDEAERRAPRRTNRLADRIHVETLKKGKQEVEVGVGPDDKEAFYARFVEFGTDPHFIKKARAQALRLSSGEFAASADHPGTREQPFLRPAFDEKLEEAVGVIGEMVNEVLEGE
jgi:HK97 gp10 family phage protein